MIQNKILSESKYPQMIVGIEFNRQHSLNFLWLLLYCCLFKIQFTKVLFSLLTVTKNSLGLFGMPYAKKTTQ